VIAALSTLTYAIIEAPRHGWGSPEILILFAVSLVCFISLVRYELRRFEPLLEVRFFRSAPFSGASAIAVAAFAAQGGFLFLNTLYLQDVRGLSPFHAGLYLLPMAVMTLICAPLSGRLVGRRGARLPMVLGGLALVAGAGMLTQLQATTAPAFLLAAYFLFGLGTGMVNPPITNTAVSGMPGSQAGVAASVASTSRQVGLTLGVAAIGTIAGSGLTGHLGPGFAVATHAAWWAVVGLGVVIVAIAVVTTTAWAEGTARRTAERFRESREPQPAPHEVLEGV
jgi:MFS family permease